METQVFGEPLGHSCPNPFQVGWGGYIVSPTSPMWELGVNYSAYSVWAMWVHCVPNSYQVGDCVPWSPVAPQQPLWGRLLLPPPSATSTPCPSPHHVPLAGSQHGEVGVLSPGWAPPALQCRIPCVPLAGQGRTPETPMSPLGPPNLHHTPLSPPRCPSPWSWSSAVPSFWTVLKSHFRPPGRGVGRGCTPGPWVESEDIPKCLPHLVTALR